MGPPRGSGTPPPPDAAKRALDETTAEMDKAAEDHFVESLERVGLPKAVAESMRKNPQPVKGGDSGMPGAGGIGIGTGGKADISAEKMLSGPGTDLLAAGSSKTKFGEGVDLGMELGQGFGGKGSQGGGLDDPSRSLDPDAELDAGGEEIDGGIDEGIDGLPGLDDLGRQTEGWTVGALDDGCALDSAGRDGVSGVGFSGGAVARPHASLEPAALASRPLDPAATAAADPTRMTDFVTTALRR
ncbi:hypothetical protein ACI2LJ_32870 [Streptomyces sp. NPDC088090]|uniref:hypothetical protein n=1 Tax=Streptomyces sp. NPDC088090 TaxID=3365822 RepID=UPI0038505F01